MIKDLKQYGLIPKKQRWDWFIKHQLPELEARGIVYEVDGKHRKIILLSEELGRIDFFPTSNKSFSIKDQTWRENQIEFIMESVFA